MLKFLGKMQLAAAIPIMASLMATLDIPALVAEIAGLTQLIISFTPPSIAGILGIIGGITAALPNFVPPSFDVKIDLGIKLELLKAKLDLLLKIKDLLLAGGLHVYNYQGAASSFGTSVDHEFVPGPSQGGIPAAGNIFVVLLVAEGSNTIGVQALQKTFATE